jgi:hypothetical protein
VVGLNGGSFGFREMDIGRCRVSVEIVMFSYALVRVCEVRVIGEQEW